MVVGGVQVGVDGCVGWWPEVVSGANRDMSMVVVVVESTLMVVGSGVGFSLSALRTR